MVCVCGGVVSILSVSCMAIFLSCLYHWLVKFILFFLKWISFLSTNNGHNERKKIFFGKWWYRIRVCFCKKDALRGHKLVDRVLPVCNNVVYIFCFFILFFFEVLMTSVFFCRGWRKQSQSEELSKKKSSSKCHHHRDHHHFHDEQQHTTRTTIPSTILSSSIFMTLMKCSLIHTLTFHLHSCMYRLLIIMISIIIQRPN